MTLVWETSTIVYFWNISPKTTETQLKHFSSGFVRSARLHHQSVTTISITWVLIHVTCTSLITQSTQHYKGTHPTPALCPISIIRSGLSTATTYLFRNLPVQKLTCSETYLFRNLPVQKLTCSETYLFRNLPVQKLTCSETYLFRNLPVQKLTCSETYLFRNLPVQKLASSETCLLFLLLVGSCVFLVCLPSSVSGPPLIWGVCFSSSSTSSWQDKYLQYILSSLAKLLKVILTISPCSHNCWINKYTALFKHSSVSSLLTITGFYKSEGSELLFVFISSHYYSYKTWSRFVF